MVLEHLDFAQAEVFLFFAVVAYVNELTRMSVAGIAQKYGFLLLEFPLEFRARLVHGFIAFQKFWAIKKYNTNEFMIILGKHKNEANSITTTKAF